MPPRPSRSPARRTVKGKWSRETCYAVTSLSVTQATPGQLAAIIRGQWGIEDRLHWVRDIDFDEDHSQVRAAAGPQIMASLHNLAITILRPAGTTGIAAALRYHARRPARPLRTIMKCQPTLRSPVDGPPPRLTSAGCRSRCRRRAGPPR
jgi:Transposase DDE domain